MMKRAFDLLVAAVLLIVFLPVMTLVAVAVWVDGTGPILYRGLRAGLHGTHFTMLKFRTMAPDTTTRRELTVQGDPRITRVGRVLRATKLDELPQLFNVLRGDMSLVGPRPESPRYVAHYTKKQRGALRIRPGITGPSQIVFRREEQLLCVPDPERYYLNVVMPAKLAIDLDYVRNSSFWGDIKIIALTVRSILWPLSPPVLPAPSTPVAQTTTHYGSEAAQGGSPP